MMSSANKPLVLAIFGALLIILGTVLCIIRPTLLNMRNLLSKELALSSTSRSFEIWNDSSKIPLYMEIYFFNWTNPQEIRIPGTKPAFVQLGPYTFLERREKVNVVFHPTNSTVSFDQRRFWHFDQSRSKGSLTDNVTQLNVVALSAAIKVKNWGFVWQSMLVTMMRDINEIHITKTVDELLFSGYSDTLIDLGKLSGSVIDIPPFDKFGWFYLRNGSAAFDGHFNMATGQDDITNVGVLRNWNYQNTSKFYKAPCNAVEGSAGEFWSPNRTKDEITLFSADICRPLIYEYQGTEVHHGITGYKYVIGDKTLSNSTKRRYSHGKAKYFDRKMSTTNEMLEMDYDEDAYDPLEDYEESDVVDIGQCFCNGECTPSGVINVTACRYGAPAFISLPHFHKADPIYRQKVDGMNPVDEKHSFSLTLEPTTGIPIDVAARLQVNILLQPLPYMSLYQDLPQIYFPMFWFNERAGITEDLAYSLRLLLNLPSIVFYSCITLFVLGSLLVIVAGGLYCSSRGKHPALNIKQPGIVFRDQKTELVYLDTGATNEDNHARLNRQLYPKLTNDVQNW